VIGVDAWEPFWAFVVAAIGVGLTLRYSRRLGTVDVPNARSSHSVPTPRGGGIALVAAVMIVMWRVLAESMVEHVVVAAILIALAALAIVGWMDDKSHVPVSVRFPIHLFGAIGIGVLVNQMHPLPGALGFLWIVWWVFWTVASINIVNFMDGIDGLVGSQGVVYGMFLFCLAQPGAISGRYGVILAAACFGFLLWNWPPAKVFLGDVGSGPLGFLFVLGGALALESAPASVVFLPLFPLFLDALLTLIGRAKRGEKLTDAHRGHLYQRLANARAGHSIVTQGYALAAAVGAVVGRFALDLTPVERAVAISTYLLVVIAAWLVSDAKARSWST
jgi:UDP-N-acetylmuramyl pentapeptide phosphotransferase/UDP-N-acetylglucosamine-1-phosphate transferase